jgi:hypothetical protein
MNEKTLILLFMAGTMVGGFSLGAQLNSINKEVKRVKVESVVSSGKAIYMPGSVCILKATSEVSEEKMREFAAACIKSHRDWLLISNDASNYSDAPKQDPSK